VAEFSVATVSWNNSESEFQLTDADAAVWKAMSLNVVESSDVYKAISIKAKAKAECLQEQDKPPPV